MGIDNIAFYGDVVGFGHKTGIDLPHEAEGVVPSSKWKLRNFRQKWYAGETISVSIGQGALTVTPLQLARAYSGIALGGFWHHPHLVQDAGHTETPTSWALSPDNVREVIDGMYGVVNEGGTGVRARLPGVEVCGKTGTAQLASNEFLKGSAAGRDMKDNAWFIGFAPRQSPEILVVTLFEGGEHGQMAAALVRDVMKAYFDKKTRLAAELKLRQGANAGFASLANLGLPAPPSATQAPSTRTPSAPEPVEFSTELDESTPPPPTPEPPRRSGARPGGQENQPQ